MFILYLYFPAVMELIPILTALVIISIWVYIFSFRVFVFPLELQYWLTSYFFILNSSLSLQLKQSRMRAKGKSSLSGLSSAFTTSDLGTFTTSSTDGKLSAEVKRIFFIVLSFLLFTLFLSMFFSFFLFLQHSVFFYSFPKRNEK